MDVNLEKMYSPGRQLVDKVLLYVLCKFPLLAWAAWQLQYSPTACGTLRKHFTKPFLRVAAPECNRSSNMIVEESFTLEITSTSEVWDIQDNFSFFTLI